MKSAPVNDQSCSLETLVEQIRLSRKLTRQDQQLLMHFGQAQPHATVIQQVYDWLRQGMIRVVD